jgi:nitronate monooxygenase
MESQGASLEELLPYISGERGRKAWLEGNLEDGSMACGQVVGLVREVVSAKELLQSIIEGAEAILREINGKVASL